MSIYDACMKYKEDGISIVVLAARIMNGFSRDWAARSNSWVLKRLLLKAVRESMGLIWL